MQNMVGSRPIYVELWPTYVFFYKKKCDCAYSWPFPSYLASPVPVNPSKVIFSIINYIQNIYCIAICAENIISDSIKNQEKICITSMLYMYVLHRSIPSIHLFISSTWQCPQGPVGRCFAEILFSNITC